MAVAKLELGVPGSSVKGMLKRDGGDGCRARLTPLLVRFRAIWGFSRHKAGSSISCRCASLGGLGFVNADARPVGGSAAVASIRG